MEVNNELDLYQKIVDFIETKNPEVKNYQFQLKIVGEEAPSTFIISVKIQDPVTSSSSTVLILYECSFHSEMPKSYINLSYVVRHKNKDTMYTITKAGEEIYYASLSSDRQFLGLTLSNTVCDDVTYSCCIINTSAVTFLYEQTRFHVMPSLKSISKFQFIQTANVTRRSMAPITSNNSFFKLQSTHVIYSVHRTIIKYQRVLISPNSTIVENENILSSKLHYHDLKSELDRLYILERSTGSNFNLKAFQTIWPESETDDMKIFEFQMLFSYEVQLPGTLSDGSLINTSILEHSNGALCLCYEHQSNSNSSNGNSYAYSVHLINSSNIIECRTPAYVTSPPGTVLFTMYKSYVAVITKCFIHLIDIYCHSKQICSYIWPTCFTEPQFLNLKCLNAFKLAKMYFLHDTKQLLSVTPNLYSIATMIKESSSLTQKVGAVNFIVYNHLRKCKTNVSKFAIECIVVGIKNSFTMSRLMEEYITASVNRYLRIKVTQERIMRFIDNTTLSGQFSSKLSPIINHHPMITDNDLIKISLQSAHSEALVVLVKENLPNPQINRFIRLRNDSDYYKNKINTVSSSAKIELVFENNHNQEEGNLPPYLEEMSLSVDQIQVIDNSITQKIGNISRIETVNVQGFVDNIRLCTVKAWKRLLILIHQTVFNDDEALWKDLLQLKKPKDQRIKCFHDALGAFRYTLLKDHHPVPSSIEEMYIVTSYNVLSNQRFLIYLSYNDFMIASNISQELFRQFYRKLSSRTNNPVLEQIKEKIFSKMPIEAKMEILPMLTKSDQDRITKEYWDNVNRQTNIFSKYYSEMIQNMSRSCDTPQTALDHFYKQSSEKIQINETLK